MICLQLSMQGIALIIGSYRRSIPQWMGSSLDWWSWVLCGSQISKPYSGTSSIPTLPLHFLLPPAFVLALFEVLSQLPTVMDQEMELEAKINSFLTKFLPQSNRNPNDDNRFRKAETYFWEKYKLDEVKYGFN